MLTKSSKYKQLRQQDVSNLLNGFDDILFNFLGIDDSSIIRSTVEKGLIRPLEDSQIHCTVKIYEMTSSAIKRLAELQEIP